MNQGTVYAENARLEVRRKKKGEPLSQHDLGRGENVQRGKTGETQKTAQFEVPTERKKTKPCGKGTAKGEEREVGHSGMGPDAGRDKEERKKGVPEIYLERALGKEWVRGNKTLKL